jgi:hypothetical protein
MVGAEHRPAANAGRTTPTSKLERPMSIFDLSGRTAVITGGNGGIGLGIAQALVGAGCNVSIWGRNAEKNKSAAASMAAGPGKVDTSVCDVSDPASVKAAMKATLDHFGRVDGCFANAGIGGGGRRAFIDRTEEEWRKMFATNLDGVFHVFQVAARHMTERAEAGDKFGRLVATSSLASLFGTARNEHYAGTKAALNALCRALGVELARYGVTANAILPGWIKSEMTAGIMANDKFVANVMPRIPARRFGEPSDFGGIAIYLMSKASSYHTADCFVIDGGYTAF